MAALWSALGARYTPAAANKALSALRGVLAAAWRLGQIDTDSYRRAIDVRNVRGSRLPEAAHLAVADVDPTHGVVGVVGKGNRERRVWIQNGAIQAISAWLAVRGAAPGPLLCASFTGPACFGLGDP